MSSRPPLCSRHEDRMEGDARARGGAEGIEAKFTWISYVWGERSTLKSLLRAFSYYITEPSHLWVEVVH